MNDEKTEMIREHTYQIVHGLLNSAALRFIIEEYAQLKGLPINNVQPNNSHSPPRHPPIPLIEDTSNARRRNERQDATLTAKLRRSHER